MNSKPSIILVNPLNGGNIGSVMRVMSNFELSDLRIVKKELSFSEIMLQDIKKLATYHSIEILNNMKIFSTVQEAINDFEYVIAFSSRNRTGYKSHHELQNIMPELVHNVMKIGFMYGNEKWGLENNELELAHAICTIPTNPKYPSLNLAQSVGISIYQWFQDHLKTIRSKSDKPEIASIHELNLFFEHIRDIIKINNHYDTNHKDIVHEFYNFCLRTYCTKRDLRLLYKLIEFLSSKK